MSVNTTSTNPCSECDEAIHVFQVKKGDEKLKLLEQAHCAKCWRPLLFNDSKWPGPHESLRPPFHSPIKPLRLSVAQCGHIFHTPCFSSPSDTHCPLCFVWIQRLRPLHYHITRNPPVNASSVSSKHAQEFDHSLEEAQQIRIKSESELADLRLKLDRLDILVDRLQKKLINRTSGTAWR